MAENKIIARLGAILDLGGKNRKKKADELEGLIKKIRKKERKVITKCRQCKGTKECEILK